MMTFGQFRGAERPLSLKFPLRDTPHLTIETNRTCNLRCRSCYNIHRDGVKSLAEVRGEIEVGLRKRNLGTLTLLGGEPTLHPHLKEIVSYVKSRGLTCQLLTNGRVLLSDRSGEFLDGLRAAGIDHILVHMDNGQNDVHPDLERSRRQLFSMLERRGIPFFLSLTIYDGDQGQIPSLVKAYSRFRYFGGVLAVLARDPLVVRDHNPELNDEYESVSRELRIEPMAYVPSNLGDGDVRWLVYFYFINAATGRALACSSSLYRVFKMLYRVLKGHQPYAVAIDPRWAALALVLAGVAECVIRPRKALTLARVMKGSGWGRTVRFHYLAVQAPPECEADGSRYRLCYHCPDATIRNGKLTPVCIADLINPWIPGSGAVDQLWFEAAYGHLSER